MKTYGIKNRNADANTERALFKAGMFFTGVATLVYVLFFFVVFGNFLGRFGTLPGAGGLELFLPGGLIQFRMPRFIVVHWVCFLMFAIGTLMYFLSIRYHGNDSSNSLALPIKTRNNPKFRFNRTALIGGVFSLAMTAWGLSNIIYTNNVVIPDFWDGLMQSVQSVSYYI